VEQGVDVGDADAQAAGGGAVDVQLDLLAAGLRVGVQAGDLGQGAQRRLDLGRPFAQHAEVVGAQAELVGGVGRAAPDADVFGRLHEHLHAGGVA
nr:hypothetical protein [Tanacetum cinerariifolium]